MGKDKEGEFHPEKGTPSAALRTESNEIKTSNERVDNNQEIADKYTVGEDEPAPHLHLRHRNRNVDKKEGRQKIKGKTPPKRKEILKPETTQSQAEEIPLPLTKEIFAELANHQANHCISLFVATTPGAEGSQKNISIFRTILQQATSLMKQKSIDDVSVTDMLKPGFDLLADDLFWNDLSQGLVVFISDNYFRYLKLPVTLKEEIVVNSSFYVSPLLPVITKNDYFYLLVISKKQAKLYRADAFGMSHVHIEEMPNGVDDVVHFEEKSDPHALGEGKPDDKANLALYFDEVDETLWKKILNREKVPLLLAGVEYLIPIYKSVAQYKPICEEAITGNHDHEDITSLYQQARKRMESYFDERHAKALTSYGNHSATELTSASQEVVIPAAHYKRVSHLFVREGEHIWGTFHEMNNVLKIHPEQQAEDEDLIDKAITKTILSGGEVHILPKERMPADSAVAAVLRY